MPEFLNAFISYPARQKLVTLLAIPSMLFAHICLHVIGLRRTYKLLRGISSIREPRTVEDGLAIAFRYAESVFLVHRRLPFIGKCLARSLTIWFLLRLVGIQSDVRFGMKKKQSEFSAHAWVEIEGTPLASEDEKAEGYVFFPESILHEFSKLDEIV